MPSERGQDVSGAPLGPESPPQAFAAWAPADGNERIAAARAVVLERKDRDDRKRLAALGDFERDLIRRAYQAGRDDTHAKLNAALGPAAATADVTTLRAVMSPRHDDGLDPELHDLPLGPALTPANRSAAKLVAGARKHADRERSS